MGHRVVFGEKEIEILQADNTPFMYAGNLREGLELRFSVGEVSLDELDELAADEAKTAKFKTVYTHEDESEDEQIFEDYTIVAKIAKERVNFDAVRGLEGEDAVVLQLVRKTLQEKQNEQILAALEKAGIEI